MLEGRATGTCNLGPLIRADVAAADSLQGTGLIKWRGSCELLGVFAPAMGTVVTFSYTVQGQASASIPKRFRVLSSFADPLANNGQGQTTIELGCLLTYMEDAAEPTELNARDDDELGNDTQADEDFDAIGASISAAYIFKQCAAAIGVTYSFNAGPLTSTFRLDTVDLEQGYVTVMGDLLVSESMVGELDANEVLQIRKLEEGASEAGKLINTTNIISIAPLNAGQLPGENVAVQYSSWSLKDPDDDDGFFSPWEKVTTVGPEVKQAIGEFPGFPTVTNTITYTPSSETTTYYKELVIDGQTRSVTDRVESVATTVLSELIPEYYAAVFAAFRDVSVYPNPSVNSYTVTTYEYNVEGDVTREESVTTEDKFALFGRMNIRLGYSRESIDPAQLLGELIETSKTVTTYQYTETKRQVATTDYVHYSMTQEGQQLSAEIGTFLYTAEKLLLMLQRLGDQGLVNQGTRVQTTLKPSQPENVAPGPTERLNVGGQDDPLERTTETVWVYGDQESIRRTVFRMPYAPDDLATGTSGNYTVVKSDAEEVARLYGRVQNKLLFGARYGLSLQVSPVKMPSMAFDPLNIDLAGVMGQFRLNNLSYVIEPGEVVCGCNALYWGVIGSTPFTGSASGSWVPLPAGMDVGDLTAAPTPTSSGTLGQVVIVPSGSILPPYTTTESYALAAYRGRFSLSGKVAVVRQSVNYSIAASRRAFAVTGRAATTQRNVPLAADRGAYTLSGAASDLAFARGITASLGVFALTGLPATLETTSPPTVNYSLGADRGAFTQTGRAAETTLLWGPYQITTYLWLDAADASTITESGGTVSQWNDKSGNSRNFTQGTGSLQPAYTASGLNGKAVLDFAGDYLTSTAAASVWNLLHNTTGSSVFVVVKAGTSANPDVAANLMGTNAGSSSNHGIAIFYDDRSSVPRSDAFSSLVTRGVGGASTVSNIADNQWTPNAYQVLGVVTDPGNGTAASRQSTRLNGGSSLANNALTNAASSSNASFTLQIGAAGNNTGPMTGGIAEVVIVSGLISAANRERMEGYLAHKWGLTGNLPGGHPYKTSAPTV